MTGKACVIGAGPNGLAAAIVLSQAGFYVDVLEAQVQPGGAARTMDLTLPGFKHDFGSAVYPLRGGSPFFSSLPLNGHGLEWIHSPAALAHPLDDGTAVMLERSLDQTSASLGIDGKAWTQLMQPFVKHWKEFAPQILGPVSFLPRNPLLMAHFGMLALQSAHSLARRFRDQRTRALFAGLAAHSFLSLDEPLSAAFGILLAVPAHAVGWPIPRGGAQSITNALCGGLATFSSKISVSSPVQDLAVLKNNDLTLCDLTPRQLLKVGEQSLSDSYKRQLASYRYGAAVFKVDYALNATIPWKAAECSRAATVHLGGSFEQIAESEKAVRSGQHPDRPFVLLAQPSLFDSSRAPAGKHTAWAYCHVPNGSAADMTERIEAQVERFAPGFRQRILARHTMGPTAFERHNPNLVGGDISGGAAGLRQLFFRPALRPVPYSTPLPQLFICSSSTPPGGGVHGLCGYYAARTVL